MKSFYETNYKGRPRIGPDVIHWSDDNQAKLEKMLAGEINSVEESAIYARALEGRKVYLTKRILNHAPSTRFEICSNVIDKMTMRKKIFLCLKLDGQEDVAYEELDDVDDQSGSSQEHQEEDYDYFNRPRPSLSYVAPPPLTELLEVVPLLPALEQRQDDNAVDMTATSNRGREEMVVQDHDENDDTESILSASSYFQNLNDNHILNQIIEMYESSDDEDGTAPAQDTNDNQEDSYAAQMILISPDPSPPVGDSTQQQELVAVDDPPVIMQTRNESFHPADKHVPNLDSTSWQESVVVIDDPIIPTNESFLADKKQVPNLDSEDENHDHVVVVRFAKITTKNNGTELLQDELRERNIDFDMKMKIRALKDLLSQKALNGKKEFSPKSSMILAAVERKEIEVVM